jgi:hypothetical protein
MKELRNWNPTKLLAAERLQEQVWLQAAARPTPLIEKPWRRTAGQLL